MQRRGAARHVAVMKFGELCLAMKSGQVRTASYTHDVQCSRQERSRVLVDCKDIQRPSRGIRDCS